MAEKPRDCRARVARIRALASEILEANLEMVEPTELHFDAGQWVSVPFGPKNVRAYSIASTPDRPSLITLCADVAPGGIGSAWFKRLAAGTDVAFKGPLGGFVWKPDESRRPFFVAEEIGIVPIRSIITSMSRDAIGRGVQLVYWARDPSWLAYHDEFIALAGQHPGFSYRPVVAPADQQWSGEVGALIDAVVRHAPSIENLVAYVAGGEATIHAVRDALTARGLDRKAVKWEKFW